MISYDVNKALWDHLIKAASDPELRQLLDQLNARSEHSNAGQR